MSYESAVNIAIGCVLASAMDRDTKQQVAERLRELEEKYRELWQRLNVLKDTTDLGSIYDEMALSLVGKLPNEFLTGFFLDIKAEKRAERLPLLKEFYEMSPTGLAAWSEYYAHHTEIAELFIRQRLGDAK